MVDQGIPASKDGDLSQSHCLRHSKDGNGGVTRGHCEATTVLWVSCSPSGASMSHIDRDESVLYKRLVLTQANQIDKLDTLHLSSTLKFHVWIKGMYGNLPTHKQPVGSKTIGAVLHSLQSTLDNSRVLPWIEKLSNLHRVERFPSTSTIWGSKFGALS